MDTVDGYKPTGTALADRKTRQKQRNGGGGSTRLLRAPSPREYLAESGDAPAADAQTRLQMRPPQPMRLRRKQTSVPIDSICPWEIWCIWPSRTLAMACACKSLSSSTSSKPQCMNGCRNLMQRRINGQTSWRMRWRRSQEPLKIQTACGCCNPTLHGRFEWPVTTVINSTPKRFVMDRLFVSDGHWWIVDFKNQCARQWHHNRSLRRRRGASLPGSVGSVPAHPGTIGEGTARA